MTDKPTSRLFTIAAVASSLIAPAAAAFYEAGRFRVFPESDLGNLWLVSILAAFGVSIGVFSVWRGAKFAGMVCFFTNTAVLALYGFLAVFFTLGGSR